MLLAAAPPAAGGHAQRLEGGRPGDAIGGQAVLPLKVFDRLGRLTAVDAIHRAVIVAPIFQLGLDDPHLLTAGALAVNGGLRRLEEGDDHNIDGEQHRQGKHQPAPVLHENPPFLVPRLAILYGGKRRGMRREAEEMVSEKTVRGE